jgi:NAD(P)-dependent dehydrogenase (short-subunit alcohol dehydrogenase family)
MHNNAYRARPDRTVVSLEEDDWDRSLDVSLKSMYLMSRYVVPHMLRASGGSIRNIGSAVGFIGTGGEPAYAAAKGAVMSFTRALAIDSGKQGIRSNCVAAGINRHRR